MFKKPLVLFSFLIILIFIFSGCSSDNSSNEEKSGKVTYFSPETLDMLEDLAEVYEEKSDVEVNVEPSGANEIVNQLIAEKGNPSGDLWYGAGGFLPFENAKEKDLLESYKPEFATDWDVYEDGIKMRDENWEWVGINFRVLGFAYNTELVSEEDAPKTWEDLLDPKWKGKMQMANPAASGTSTLIVLSQLLRLGEEDGWDYFDQLTEQMSTMPDKGSAPAKAVAQGEAEISIGFAYHAYTLKGEGEDIDFILPEETPVLANPAAIIKGAPNEKEGEKMMEFLMSKEAQQIFADNYMITVNDDVEPKIPLTLDDLKNNAQEMDVDWVVENYDDAREEWRERYE